MFAFGLNNLLLLMIIVFVALICGAITSIRGHLLAKIELAVITAIMVYVVLYF